MNRASMDADFKKRPAPDILLTHLMEGIGIALDFKGDRMFLTDLAGSVYSAKLDGSEKKPLLVAQGNLTGIAYAERIGHRKIIMSYNKPIRQPAKLPGKHYE